MMVMRGNKAIGTLFKPTGFIWALILLQTACQNNPPGTEKSVQEFQTAGKISSIIRNPVTLDGPVDTVNVARMEFETTVFDFGEVPEGRVVTHVFKFTNNGRVPLVINNAQSTCGCTVPSWPKKPIPPGGNAEIKVEFNTNGKQNFQEKPVTITANTFPASTKIYLKGMVRPEVQ